jgi:flagellar motility protein MotE (MotC chaperone)
MRRLARSISFVALMLLWLASHGSSSLRKNALAASPQAANAPSQSAGGNSQAPSAKTVRDEAEGLEIKRRQLAEKEAALNAKEQELKNAATGLDSRINQISSLKKSLDDSLVAKKKVDDERYVKMMKLFKKMKAEESAKLMDKLEEDVAIEMLNRLDQKTTLKLIPYLNQPRVLKWVKENLQAGR